MREMILNQASVKVGGQTVAVVGPKLADVAQGMALLITKDVVERFLRMRCFLHEIPCADDGNLYDVVNWMQRQGRYVEEVRFLLRLAQKVPLLLDLPPDVMGKFRSCQAKELDAASGEALLLCVINGGVAISLPIETAWDTDRLSVCFLELVSDDEISESTDTIDNVARVTHAEAIVARHASIRRKDLTPPTFWASKDELFPFLRFAPGVRAQVEASDVWTFQILVNRFCALNDSAAHWNEQGAALPVWQCNVTPESEKTMKNKKCVAARTFESMTGKEEIFELHARFGSGGRIHLLLHATERRVEIGYVGPHLPVAG